MEQVRKQEIVRIQHFLRKKNTISYLMLLSEKFKKYIVVHLHEVHEVQKVHEGVTCSYAYSPFNLMLIMNYILFIIFHQSYNDESIKTIIFSINWGMLIAT